MLSFAQFSKHFVPHPKLKLHKEYVLESTKYNLSLVYYFSVLCLVVFLIHLLHHMRLVAEALSRHVREIDVMARFGDDEFVVLLLETPSDEAVKVAERMRETVESIDYPNLAEPFSLSIDHVQLAEHTPEQFFESSDKMLYRAKAGGKNKVMSTPVTLS